MSSDKCPNCGPELIGMITRRTTGGIEDACLICGDNGQDCYRTLTLGEALQRIAYLEQAVRVRDERRFQDVECGTICTLCQSYECVSDCPTKTHPVEGLHK